MTTIEILGAGERPPPPAPMRPRVAVVTIALLLVGGGLLAWVAGPEPVTPASQSDPPVSPLP